VIASNCFASQECKEFSRDLFFEMEIVKKYDINPKEIR
jgi:hypothetical protein